MEIDGGHFEALNLKATNLLLMGHLQESVAEIYKVRVDGGRIVSCKTCYGSELPNQSAPHHVGSIPFPVSTDRNGSVPSHSLT